MYPIGVHSGVQSGVQSGVDLKSYCMTYMIIHMNKGLDRKLYTSCICSIYEKWGTIKHVPHVPHWGTLWGTKWGTISNCLENFQKFSFFSRFLGGRGK